MATTVPTNAQSTSRAEPVIRKIGTADLREALARGWDDFKAIPTQLFFLCILYAVIGLIAARAAATGRLMPLLWPMVSGFALVGPVAALGLYEISRRREKGLAVAWYDVFKVLRSPAIVSIAFLAVAMVVIFVAWLFVAQAIYDGTMGNYRPASFGEFLNRVFTTREGWQLIILGNGVGFLFSAVVLALTVVSFPMLLDRNVEPGLAVRTSVRAVLAHPVPMALWGVIVGVLIVLGSIPLFIGLAVVLPVLGHATWHLYRHVVAE